MKIALAQMKMSQNKTENLARSARETRPYLSLRRPEFYS